MKAVNVAYQVLLSCTFNKACCLIGFSCKSLGKPNLSGGCSDGRRCWSGSQQQLQEKACAPLVIRTLREYGTCGMVGAKVGSTGL